MNHPTCTKNTSFPTGIFYSVCRIALGLAFTYMGLNKALDPITFLKAIRQYDLLETPVLQFAVAAYLPWFEVFLGALLVLGIAVRSAALVVASMLIPFTALVLRQGLIIHQLTNLPLCAIRFDCGCGTGEVNLCQKLVENTMMFLAALFLLVHRSPLLCLRYELFRKD